MDAFQQFGLVVIFGFIFYLVYFYYNKYYNQTENFEVHGGSTTDKIDQKLKDSVAKQTDILLISKYRKNYESIISNMKQYIAANLVQLTLQIDPKESMTDANLKIFADINTLKSSYDNMETILKYIDESN